jgi:hypothetical protein
MIRRPKEKRRAGLTFESLEARRLLAGNTIATAESILLVSGEETTVMADITVIAPAGEFDIYSISLNAGDSVSIKTVAGSMGSPLDTLLRLFDAAGSELDRNDDFDRNISADSKLTFEATNAGTFYVGVSTNFNGTYDPNVLNTFGEGIGGAPGPYDLKVLLTAAPPMGDGNDTLASAVSVDFVLDTTKTLSGEIDPGGDVDLFSIQLSAGQTVTVDTDAFDPPDNTLDTLLRVFDANGNEIALNDNDGFTLDSELSFVAPTDGTFFVGVSGVLNSQYDPNVEGSGSGTLTGDYDLNVLVVPVPIVGDGNDTLATAVSVDFVFDITSTLNGEIDPGGDVDLFSLALKAGETVTVDTDAFAPPGNVLNTLLRVFDAAGNVIASNDNDGATSDSELTFEAPADGTFFVGVSGAINQNYDPNAEGSGFGPLTGSYDLNVLVGAAPPPPDGNDTLATAENVAFTPDVLTDITGDIDPAGDVDVYRLDLNAGDTLTLDIDAATAGSALDSLLRVFDAAGSELARNDNDSATSDSALTFEVLADGPLFVGVSGAINAAYDPNVARSGTGIFVGAFTLGVLVTPAPPPPPQETEPNDTFAVASNIPLNEDVAASLEDAGDRDVYAFTLTEPGRLTATIFSAEPLFDSRLDLFSADQQRIISNDDTSPQNLDPRLVHHLPAGDYFLVAAASGGGSAIGEYTLRASLVAATPPTDDLPTGIVATAIAASDFDGDGIMDLVVANRFSSDVSVLLGLGDGTYREQVSYPTGAGPADVAIGDFNGDGHDDLATANQFSGNVSILLGVGDGTFAPQALLPAGFDPRELALGDLNNDGVLDLVVANAASHNVSVLLGVGDGTFTPADTLAVGMGPQSLVIGDFDNNGHNDIAVANRTSGDVSILLSDAAGGFLAEQRVDVGDEPTSITAGDFNGDGRTDLAVANALSDDVSILIGQGDGTFQTGEAINIRMALEGDIAGDFTSTLLAADFNNDGRLDLAVTHSNDPLVAVALGQGDGTFAARHLVTVTGQPQDLVVADLDGDSRLDLATAGGLLNVASVRIGLGDGSFQETQRFSVGDEPRDLIAGDFDNDGRADLVVANLHDTSVLLGQGDGTLAEQMRLPGGDPRAIATGDFNRDGRTDLATANLVGGDVSVRLGLGDGTYSDAVSFDVGDQPASIIAADLDGDGFVDLATANLTGEISILLGSGDGSFGDNTRLSTGGRPLGLVAADFNDDGLIDLAVANSLDDDVSVFLSTGQGTFAAGLRLTVGDDPRGLVAGDFNNDGRVDLAVAAIGSDDVSLLLGRGNGDFDDRLTVGVGTHGESNQPRRIVAGDFDNDNLLDLAVANSADQDISVLRGQGDGTFEQLARVPVGIRPTGLAAVDMNGDGRLDLAAVGAFGKDVTDTRGNVVVVLGKGDGTFRPTDRFASNSTGATPQFGDVNGDGTTDTIVLNSSGEILLRIGRPDEPGVFDAPFVVNPSQPARTLSLVEAGGEMLIAAIDLRSDSISLYAVADDGAITAQPSIDTVAQPVRIIAAELNHDGHQDLLVAGAGSGELQILLGDAAGSFTPQPTIAAVRDPSALQVRDINGDGLNDILIADQISGSVATLTNEGDAQFVVEYRLPVGFGPAVFQSSDGGPPARRTSDGTAALALGDFNEDGIVDRVAANRGANDLAVLLGKAGGGHVESMRLLTGSRPIAVAVGDFNGDGHEDLASLAAAASQIDVFLGDGLGGFTATDVLDAGNSPTGLSLSDADGNGTLDLIVGNRFGDVLTLQGIGDGTFETFTRVGRNVSIAVGDIDGDGRDDWVVTNETLDRVALQLGGEPAPFEQDRNDGIAAPGAVATGDLNHDGLLDIVVANSGGNNILVYLGTGNGQFADARSFAAGTNPVAVTLDDVNNDGRLDVVITNQGSNDLILLLGDPHDLLRPGPRLDVGQGPVNSLVGDFNDDGLADLLVVSEGSDQAFFLAGLGGGFFAPDTTFDTGAGPQTPFVGDFNGDGNLDLVTLNFRDNSLSLFPGFDAGARIDISSGGVGPLAGVTSDFNGDGVLDLVIGNNGNGALSVFVGGEAGLVLANTIFDEDLQHPTALALAETGEGSELSLLVADEGDELVRVFGRETVLGDDDQLFAVIEEASNSSSTSTGGSISAVLAALTSFVFDFGDVDSESDRLDDGSGGELAGGAFQRFLTLLDAGWQWASPTLQRAGEMTGAQISIRELGGALREIVSKVTGGELSDDKLTEALEKILETALPSASWRMLEALRNAINDSIKSASAPDADAVDEVLGPIDENGDENDEEVDENDEERSANSNDRDDRDNQDAADDVRSTSAMFTNWLRPTGGVSIDLSYVEAAQWPTIDRARHEAFALLEQQHRGRPIERQIRHTPATRIDGEDQVADSIDWQAIGLATVLSAATIKGYTDHKKHGITPRLGGRYA